jgi:hypothetical protein
MKMSVPAAKDTTNMMNHLDDLNSTNLGRSSFFHHEPMPFETGHNSVFEKEVGQTSELTPR